MTVFSGLADSLAVTTSVVPPNNISLVPGSLSLGRTIMRRRELAVGLAVAPDFSKEALCGQEVICRQSQLRDHRQRFAEPFWAVRHGSVRPGHHGSRHGSVERLWFRR